MTRVVGPMCAATAVVRPDRHDPPAADREGLGPAPGGVHRRDAAAGQDEVGGLSGVGGHGGLRVTGTDRPSLPAARGARRHPAGRDAGCAVAPRGLHSAP